MARWPPRPAGLPLLRQTCAPEAAEEAEEDVRRRPEAFDDGPAPPEVRVLQGAEGSRLTRNAGADPSEGLLDARAHADCLEELRDPGIDLCLDGSRDRPEVCERLVFLQERSPPRAVKESLHRRQTCRVPRRFFLRRIENSGRHELSRPRLSWWACPDSNGEPHTLWESNRGPRKPPDPRDTRRFTGYKASLDLRRRRPTSGYGIHFG